VAVAPAACIHGRGHQRQALAYFSFEEEPARRSAAKHSPATIGPIQPRAILLRGIAERGGLAPLFVVATTRPEFRPPWGMRSYHGMVALAPLDRHQVRDVVSELAAATRCRRTWWWWWRV